MALRDWSWKRWFALFVGLSAAAMGVAGYVLYRVVASGATRPMDNMFDDQHLKTTVALIELHHTRYGTYPAKIADLTYVGQWDMIALSAVSYCASADGQAYFVEVTRGWAARPDLHLPAGFWQGTGYSPAVGPCR